MALMNRDREKVDSSQLEIKDTVVSINRVTKVVKGGKNLSFSALVVVGDGHGVVGFGVGKAKEVPSAIKKGIDGGPVHTGNGDVRSDAIHAEQRKRKENTVAEVGNREQVLQRVIHRSSPLAQDAKS